MPEGDTALAGTDSKLQAEFVEAAKRAKALQTRQRLKSTGSASLAEGGAEALKLLDARRDKRMDPRGEPFAWRHLENAVLTICIVCCASFIQWALCAVHRGAGEDGF